MRFKIPRLRPVGVAAVAALTAGTAFVGLTAGPASAAVAGTVGFLPGSSPAVVVASQSNQAGRSLELTGVTATTGDTITLSADDSDGGNCVAAGDTVGFHAAPTVTDTTGTGTSAVFTVALASSVPCAAVAGGPIHDMVVITFNASTTSARTLDITSIAYDLGNKVATGNLVVHVLGATPPAAGVDLTGSPINDATIIAVVVTGNNPPTGIAPLTGAQPISPVVIAETEPGQLLSGNWVCLAIVSPSPNGPNFTKASPPTVTTNGNGSQVSSGQPAAVPGNTSSMSFNPSSAAAPTQTFFQVTTQSSGSTNGATYTVSGIKLDTGSATGPVVVQVGQSGTSAAAACTNASSGAPNVGKAVVTAIIGVNRIGGSDRYGTAAQLFSPFGAGCSTSGLNAVLARGDLFPDALAASYLAGSLNQGFDDRQQGAGILLTTPSALPDVTVAALRQSGVTDVFIVGQTSAVSQAVEDQLKATPSYVCGGSNQRTTATGGPQFLHVTRIGGATRYDTAQLIAQEPNPSFIGTADIDGDTVANPMRTGIVARGDNFPDALAASPMGFWGDNVGNYFDDICSNSAVSGCGTGTTNSQWGTGKGTFADTGRTLSNGFPVVLTTPGSLSSQAQAALLNNGIKQVILMGGTAAISDATAAQITALGITVVRLAGVDRSDTAAKAAALETGTFSDLPTSGNFACNASAATPTCSKPSGLFYRTNHVNVARGDDAGGGADALSGGPHAAGIDSAVEFHGTGTRFEGPTPVLLTLDPNTLGSTRAYLVANAPANVPTNVFSGATPSGGITTVDVFGQTVAITTTTATAIQNALTGA